MDVSRNVTWTRNLAYFTNDDIAWNSNLSEVPPTTLKGFLHILQCVYKRKSAPLGTARAWEIFKINAHWQAEHPVREW